MSNRIEQLCGWVHPLGVAIAVVVLILCGRAYTAPPRSPSAQNPYTYAVNLGGRWRFALDRTDSGEKTKWYNATLPDQITLPGVLQAQFFGDEISTSTPWALSLYDRFWYLRDDYKAYTQLRNTRVPFLSQPPRHYLGVAWYQRDIQILPYMVSRRVVLTLERPHWETTVWIDDRRRVRRPGDRWRPKHVLARRRSTRATARAN